MSHYFETPKFDEVWDLQEKHITCHGVNVHLEIGLPCWLSGKESACQCRRWGFDPQVGKIPWRRGWSTPVVSDPQRPHGLQPSRLLHPWDFPDKSTGVGCHHLLRIAFLFFLNFILFFNFTILYWFCHISTWIHHRHTRVPHPEPSSLLPPHTIPLGHMMNLYVLVTWD